jgi:SP family arabinose:H+ symporter-like MFS transporter
MEQIRKGYLYLLSSVAALGGFLFGFDIAIITGAMPFFEKHFRLTPLGLGAVNSSLLFGCILGSAVAGWVTDRYGRKRMMILVAMLFAGTSVACGIAPTATLLSAARFLGGLAVGAISVLSPMYIAEIAPASIRGRFTSLYQLSITIGIVISYFINYLLRDAPHNWRWMFVTGVLPSALFLTLLFLVPETPRFLFKIGKESEAFKVLRDIGGEELARRELEEIRGSFAEAFNGFAELNRPGVRRALLVGFVLAVLVQVSGINAIIDYAPRILQTAGWQIDAALFSTFGLGIVNVVFTLVSVYTIDRSGRKPLYIIGSIGMTAALLLLTMLSWANAFTGTFVLSLCILYLMFFSSCIGPVFWTLMSELFPNRIRGLAMSIPVFTQWFFNAIVVLLFPWMFHNAATLSWGLLAIMALLQALFTWLFVPETKGKSLEQIEHFWHQQDTKSARQI